jgi:hypothetical protein
MEKLFQRHSPAPSTRWQAVSDQGAGAADSERSDYERVNQPWPGDPKSSDAAQVSGKAMTSPSVISETGDTRLSIYLTHTDINQVVYKLTMSGSS